MNKNLRNYQLDWFNSDRFLPTPSDFGRYAPIECSSMFWNMTFNGVSLFLRKRSSRYLRFSCICRDNISRFSCPVPLSFVKKQHRRSDGFVDYFLYDGNDYADALDSFLFGARYFTNLFYERFCSGVFTTKASEK